MIHPPGIKPVYPSPEPDKTSYSQKVAAALYQASTGLQKATHATLSAVPPVSTPPDPIVIFDDFRYLSMIDIAMAQNPPNTALALKYANMLYSQPSVNYMIQNFLNPLDGANVFTFDPVTNQITGIDATNWTNTWDPQTSQGKASPTGLLYTMLQWVSNPNNYTGYSPQEKSNPMMFVDYMMAYVDVGMREAIPYQWDTNFWGSIPQEQGGHAINPPETVATAFPYFLSVGLWQEIMVTQQPPGTLSDFTSQLDDLYTLLSAAAPSAPAPNYDGMLAALQATKNAYDSGETKMPPTGIWPEWVTDMMQGKFDPFNNFFVYEANYFYDASHRPPA